MSGSEQGASQCGTVGRGSEVGDLGRKWQLPLLAEQTNAICLIYT